MASGPATPSRGTTSSRSTSPSPPRNERFAQEGRSATAARGSARVAARARRTHCTRATRGSRPSALRARRSAAAHPSAATAIASPRAAPATPAATARLRRGPSRAGRPRLAPIPSPAGSQSPSGTRGLRRGGLEGQDDARERRRRSRPARDARRPTGPIAASRRGRSAGGAGTEGGPSPGGRRAPASVAGSRVVATSTEKITTSSPPTAAERSSWSGTSSSPRKPMATAAPESATVPPGMPRGGLGRRLVGGRAGEARLAEPAHGEERVVDAEGQAEHRDDVDEEDREIERRGHERASRPGSSRWRAGPRPGADRRRPACRRRRAARRGSGGGRAARRIGRSRC